MSNFEGCKSNMQKRRIAQYFASCEGALCAKGTKKKANKSRKSKKAADRRSHPRKKLEKSLNVNARKISAGELPEGVHEGELPIDKPLSGKPPRGKLPIGELLSVKTPRGRIAERQNSKSQSR